VFNSAKKFTFLLKKVSLCIMDSLYQEKIILISKKFSRNSKHSKRSLLYFKKSSTFANRRVKKTLKSFEPNTCCSPMMLIEKVVKLLDDFHFDIFREHVKNTSLRSYYPLALIDVIDRDFMADQSGDYLFFQIYGDQPEGEKDQKKLHQMGYYTFRMTGFLAKNYPNYLQHNVTRIQHLINTGKLEAATKLAEMTRDVAEKIEDFDTEVKVLEILALGEVLLDSFKETFKHYERMEYLANLKVNLYSLNTQIVRFLKDKGKDKENVHEVFQFLAQFVNSDSFSIQIIAKLHTCHFYYLSRDAKFYEPTILNILTEIEDALQKNGYIIFPFLQNIQSKLHFLKLNYSIRQLESEKVLESANQILQDSKEELFWNSFINIPELSSIGIQTSYLISNHFTSYRSDHLDILPNEANIQISILKARCEQILEEKDLEEKSILRYINLITMYACLLLLGSKENIQEGIDRLENILFSYQQSPFHSAIDTVYNLLIIGYFCMGDNQSIEKHYRRYKKSTKKKVVNQENDQTILGLFLLSKWIETSRDQYVKKLEALLVETKGKSNLSSTRKLLIEISTYFKMPLTLATLE